MHLFIIRGLPGSGKSTLAHTLGHAVYEADQYFEKEEGYVFDPAQLPTAHAHCQERTLRRLVEGMGNDVVVANTFSQRWELEPYLRMASAHRARVTVVDLFDGGLDDAALVARCVHGVPERGIAAMRSRWEHDWRSGDPRPPWERERK